MNKYLRVGITASIGIVKCIIIKTFRWKSFSPSFFCLISPSTEIQLDKGGFLSFGRRFKMRGGSKIRIRSNGKVMIGNKFSMSNGCRIICHEAITIGNDVQFGPGVLIYDHDHDVRTPGGLAAGKFKSKPVIIGNNVWIGANSIILRGSELGDNCVVAAGTVVREKYPKDVLIYNKRENLCRPIIDREL